LSIPLKDFLSFVERKLMGDALISAGEQASADSSKRPEQTAFPLRHFNKTPAKALFE